MFWIVIILLSIFVIPTILSIVMGFKANDLVNDKKSGIDWWTIGMMADLHNKSHKKDTN